MRTFVFAVLATWAGMPFVYGQADMSVELNHLQRLSEEGRWVEAVNETGRLIQSMAKLKQQRMPAPVANGYYTIVVLRARLAGWAGDLEAAEKAIKEADAIGSDVGFRGMLAAMTPTEQGNDEQAKRLRLDYEAGILMRDFALDDAKTTYALATNAIDEAENLMNVNFQKRRSGGGGLGLVGLRKNGESLVISPQTLAALSTFEPSRSAALLYLRKQQLSRARSYLLDAERTAAEVLGNAFPVDSKGLQLVPEWPTDETPPTTYQREAARVRAAVRQLRGAVEAADGNLEKAEAAFDESLDLWHRGYEQDHPEALPALLGNCRIAVVRAEQAKERRDVKTAASRAKKAERLLATARKLLESSAVTESPQKKEWQELADRVAALDSSSADLSGLEVAERAAREALRSLSKYKTPGAPAIVRPAAAATPVPAPAPAQAPAQ